MYGPTWPFLLICGPCVVIEKNIGTGCHVIGIGCILGRAPRTKETLPDFRLNPESWKMGLNEVVSGYPTSMKG